MGRSEEERGQKDGLSDEEVHVGKEDANLDGNRAVRHTGLFIGWLGLSVRRTVGINV